MTKTNKTKRFVAQVDSWMADALTPLFPGRRQPGLVLPFILCALALLAVLAVSQGPTVLLSRTPMLSYLFREDPQWLGKEQEPLKYFESKSHVKGSRQLGYWPDISAQDVRPDTLQERPPLEGTLAWSPGNGYGVELMNSRDGTVFSGDPVPVTHGFMGQGKCAKSVECQNADVCKDGKCKPAIFDGIKAVEASVAAAAAAKWPSAPAAAATARRVGPPKSFGQQQLQAQMSVLRELDAQAAADDKRMGMSSSTKHPVVAKAARMQRLAMGGGTPLDLTFGVGKDGEPPYHLSTVAESVRNGLLDPNAPDVLPYTTVGGSGTTGQMAAVGYMQPLPQFPAPAAGDIEGTVAPAE